MQKNTVENNFVQTPKLVCVKTPRGRYTLNTVNANGDMRRVKSVGFGAEPFQIVSQFPGTPFVAIKRYVATKTGNQPCLYLLNTQTGKIDEQTRNGVAGVSYNPQTRTFYFEKNLQMFTANDAGAMNILLMWLLLQRQTDSAIIQKIMESPSSVYAVCATTHGTPMMVVPHKPRTRIKRRRLRKNRKLRARNKRRITLNQVRKKRKPVRMMRPAMHAKFEIPYALKSANPVRYGKPRINANNMPNMGIPVDYARIINHQLAHTR